MDIISFNRLIAEFHILCGTGILNDNALKAEVMGSPGGCFQAHVGLHPNNNQSGHPIIFKVLQQICFVETVDLLLGDHFLVGKGRDILVNFEAFFGLMADMNNQLFLIPEDPEYLFGR